MKIRNLIKASELTADKKREIDDVISSYNERLFANQSKSRAVFGQLIMDIVECDHLFEIVPTDGIPTYNEFMEYDSRSEEFLGLVRKYKEGVSIWFEKIFESLNLYLILDSDKIKTELILLLIYVVGCRGQIKWNRNNRFAMICRMLFYEFGFNIQED